MVLQVVDDVVQVVSSLIQWQPGNILVDSSSRYYRIMLGCMVVSCIMGPSLCNCAHYFSVVESFEAVISLYAQQLTLNESQNFTAPSLTLVAELVSSCIFIYTQNY